MHTGQAFFDAGGREQALMEGLCNDLGKTFYDKRKENIDTKN
jgi:hypothetical protein